MRHFVFELFTYHATGGDNQPAKIKSLARYNVAKKQIAGVMILLFLFSFSLVAQDQTLRYDVIYKGDRVGNMQVNENRRDGTVNLKMVSSVQMHMIFAIKVYTEEASFFKDGKLVYSSLYRRVNGKEKANKQTRAVGSTYEVSSEGNVDRVNNEAIEFNVHSLYFHEPAHLEKVYSDNFLKLLPLKKMSEHIYKVELPDGNGNYYYYKNGICNKVEAHTSMGAVEILLKQ